ncbi:MAG: PqqD family protein [Acidobacteria bacterium]|nr:PqqD family protein [Acidobacteriota bacterium]
MLGETKKGADIQVIIANHIIVQPVGREAILLGLEDNVYYELNETGVFVFEQLRAGNGIDAIAQKLSDQFDVDLDTATRDVKMLIESLIQKGIVSKLDLV